MKKFLLVLFALFLGFIIWQHQAFLRIYQGAIGYFSSRNHGQFYRLQNNQQIIDITEQLKNNPKIPMALRTPLLNGQRKIYVFKYLSDGNEVAGYLSVLTKGEHPTILFLRGGNGNFGILRPNNTFSFIDGYNVLGTLYRGNVYGGNDEFGGADINDVDNLIQFIPMLRKATNKPIKTPSAIIGVSRGAMQMFISLSRIPAVKSKITKAISLSGNIDLNVTSAQRPEMHYMFEKKFKEQSKFKDYQAWLDYRNPTVQANHLNPNLSVLLLYGTKDNRVPLAEQKNFYNALRQNKIDAKYIEISDAGHDMDGHIDEVKRLITQFLASQLPPKPRKND